MPLWWLWILALADVTIAVDARWAQSSLFLINGHKPAWALVSGKTFLSGQTAESSPTTSGIVSLALDQPIYDLTKPPWIEAGNGPTAAYGSAVSFGSMGLFFGGDATGDTLTPIQTRNDSAWTVDRSAWTRQPEQWAAQPQRRQSGYFTAASNGSAVHAWYFGGQRLDSRAALDELWTFEAPLSVQDSVDWTKAQWTEIGVDKDVPPMYDGVAVVITSPEEGPTVYFIGGVEIAPDRTTRLVDLSSIWRFLPASNEWSLLSTHGNAPPARRGHVAVGLARRIWLYGGRNLAGDVVYEDAWMLDLDSATWSEAKSEQPRWAHSAVAVGDLILVAFGAGGNAPASTDLAVYSTTNDTWLSAYLPPSALLPSAGSPDSTEPAIPTGSSPLVGATGAPTSNAAWTVPGLGVEPSSTSTPHSGSPPTPKAGIIAGSIVGSLVALALVATALVARVRTNRNRYRPTFTGDLDSHEDGDSLISHRSSSLPIATMRSLSSSTFSLGNSLPINWLRLSKETKERRFDMLHDEEWSASESALDQADARTATRDIALQPIVPSPATAETSEPKKLASVLVASASDLRKKLTLTGSWWLSSSSSASPTTRSLSTCEEARIRDPAPAPKMDDLLDPFCDPAPDTDPERDPDRDQEGGKGEERSTHPTNEASVSSRATAVSSTVEHKMHQLDVVQVASEALTSADGSSTATRAANPPLSPLSVRALVTHFESGGAARDLAAETERESIQHTLVPKAQLAVANPD